MRKKQRNERRQLKKSWKAGETARHTQRNGKSSFEAWLRGRGLHEQAEQWRYRNRLKKAQPAPAPTPLAPTVPPDCTEAQQLDKYLAAVNADRVRVTCLRMMEDGSRKAFILDKQDGATRGFAPEKLRAHIPTMLRLQQPGQNIYYTPLSKERHHILIDDITRNAVEKLYNDGFLPAVVLESSPGNYQYVLTIAKLQGLYDREVGNRITERLNKQYGDPKLSGCIHPHRAPGFANLKPKHRNENGAYLRVKLHQAEKRECAKALQLSPNIAHKVCDSRSQKIASPAPCAHSITLRRHGSGL